MASIFIFADADKNQFFICKMYTSHETELKMSLTFIISQMKDFV